MGPLEHLVAGLVLKMILFLNLIQREIYNSRENDNRRNEDHFSFILSVTINMPAKAIFSLQAKISHRCTLVIQSLHSLT